MTKIDSIDGLKVIIVSAISNHIIVFVFEYLCSVREFALNNYEQEHTH